MKRRISFSSSKLAPWSGGGGVVPPVGGIVNWGPQFGNVSEETIPLIVGVDDVFIDTDFQTSSNLDILSISYTVDNLPASKDNYVPTAKTLDICNDNTNKNGQDLLVSNVILDNNSKIFISWNLSVFPIGLTVLSAVIKLKPKTAPILSHVYHLRGILQADENWNESTISCGSVPASTVPDQSYTQNTSIDQISIDITNSFSSYIQERMGVGYCTIVIEDQDVVGQAQAYQSKDEGVDNNFGPSLSLTFSGNI